MWDGEKETGRRVDDRPVDPPPPPGVTHKGALVKEYKSSAEGCNYMEERERKTE